MGKLDIRNRWSGDRCRDASDGFNRVMDRTWYCVGGNAVKGLDLFWEYNNWRPGQEGRSFTNHTVTRKPGGKQRDYGIWSGVIDKEGLFAMRPKLTVLGLGIPMPFRLATEWLTFPAEDTADGLWTYCGESSLPRGTFVFIWALTPHIADEVYEAELERLKVDNGLDTAVNPLTRVPWDASYELGSTGEDKVNEIAARS